MGLYFHDFYALRAANQAQKDKVSQLNYCNMPELDKRLFDFKKLRQLAIVDCSLSHIPEGLAALKQLTQLTIKNVLLDALPKDFDQLGSLTFFCLSDCLVTQLPPSLWRIKSLVELKLEDLTLRDKRIQLGDLPNLKRFTVKKCGLARLEADFAQLKQLETLNLSANKLNALPQGLEKATGLLTLDISGNPIAEFPREVLTYPNLNVLHCDKVTVFHANFRQPKLNTAFYSTRRALNADENLAFSLYLLLSGDQKQCENIPLGHLLIALSSGCSIIADTARQNLEEKADFHLQKSPIKPASKLLLLGRLARERDGLSEQLQQLEITLQTKQKNDATHIILGKNINPAQAQIAETANLPFFFEPALENYLKNSGIMAFADGQQAPEDEKMQLESLSQLLQSGDFLNIQLALEILKQNGLPSALITDIFALYNAIELPTKLRTELGKLLYRNASPKLWEKSQKKRNIFGGIFKPDALAFCLEETELDLAKLLEYAQRFCKARPPRPATCFQLFAQDQRAEYLRQTADSPFFFDIVGVERSLQKWVLGLNVLKRIQYRRDAVFHDEIFACDKLEELVIDGNAKAAKRLPMLAALPNLHYLRAWAIKLKEVPAVFYAMRQLKTIDVRFNDIPHSAVDFSIYDETTFMHTGILTRFD